jgi:hypothetical protein
MSFNLVTNGPQVVKLACHCCMTLVVRALEMDTAFTGHKYFFPPIITGQYSTAMRSEQLATSASGLPAVSCVEVSRTDRGCHFDGAFREPEFLKVSGPSVHETLLALLIFLIAVMDNPYRGKIGVSPDPSSASMSRSCHHKGDVTSCAE